MAQTHILRTSRLHRLVSSLTACGETKRFTSTLTQALPTSTNRCEPFSSIPGPYRIPLWGNLLYYKLGIYDWSQYHKVLCHLHEKYGPIVREDLGPKFTVIHVFSPDDARLIYAAETRTPIIYPLQEAVQLYRKRNNLSPGLGNTNGEEWYRLRSGVRHLMLQPREVSQYLPEVDAATNLLMNRILARRNQSEEVATLEDEVSKWSLETTGRICFGHSLRCFSEGPEEPHMQYLVHCNKEMFYLSARMKFSLPMHSILPTPGWRKVTRNENALLEHVAQNTEKTVQEISRYVEDGNPIPPKFSFISHLLSSESLDRKDVTVLTFSLFLDGLTTTVPTLLFNFHNLACYPDAQEKLYEEVCKAMPDPDEPITPQILGNLPYLKAFVKETFRTLPNGTDISRVLEKDLILSNYHIPAGTHVNINMIVNFKSEKFFSKPEVFMPERWLRSDETEAVHPFVLTPFGHGTRTCVGRRFAEQDLYVSLARTVRKFKLSCKEKKELKTVFHTLVLPDGPVRVSFTPRSA